MIDSSSPRTAWVVTAGHAGHTLPCIGVAERLGLEPRLITVTPSLAFKVLAPWGPAALGDIGSNGDDGSGGKIGVTGAEWPDLLLASGRQSIPYARAIRRKSAGRTFVTVLQNPVVPPAWFDLVWVNEHDGLTGPNVVRTLTTPHRLAAERLAEAATRLGARLPELPRPLVGVILGGPSKAFRFGASEVAALGRDLKALSDTHGVGLVITPSRRTGEENVAALREILDPRHTWIWDGTGDNPYFGLLGLCQRFVVTCDSVNMLGEAAFTGKPIHGYPLPGQTGRVSAFHTRLVERDIMRWFDGSLDEWTYQPLNATDIVAAAIQKRFADRRRAPTGALRA